MSVKMDRKKPVRGGRWEVAPLEVRGRAGCARAEQPEATAKHTRRDARQRTRTRRARDAEGADGRYSTCLLHSASSNKTARSK